MATDEENRQWSAENGFCLESSFCSNWLASKSPLM